MSHTYIHWPTPSSHWYWGASPTPLPPSSGGTSHASPPSYPASCPQGLPLPCPVHLLPHKPLPSPIGSTSPTHSAQFWLLELEDLSSSWFCPPILEDNSDFSSGFGGQGKTSHNKLVLQLKQHDEFIKPKTFPFCGFVVTYFLSPIFLHSLIFSLPQKRD